MSPRARRSESITLPPGNQPGLIRYNDDVLAATEKLIKTEIGKDSTNDPSSISDDRYDTNDMNCTTEPSDSNYNSQAADEDEDCGR
jgi:hypothetical protein